MRLKNKFVCTFKIPLSFSGKLFFAENLVNVPRSHGQDYFFAF